MKYLDRNDLIEIGIIFALFAFGVTMLTLLILAVWSIAHSIQPGCVPNVIL